MRRLVLVLTTAVLAALAFAPLASAVGPGGWDHVGVGGTATTPALNGTSVTALNTQNPGVLYVGGNFTSAGGVSKAQRIARWDGTAWSAIGGTPLTNGGVFAIAYHAGKVYVGGTFVDAGGDADADFLAVWDGSTWSSPCTSTTPGPAFGGSVAALQIIGDTLYVGGSFQNGAGIAAADYLVACNLTTGAASSTVPVDGDLNGGVYALAADSNGTLYAGGQFINLAGIPEADHVASYNGASWQALGGSAGAPAVDSFVRSLTARGTDVYVGTDSLDVAGIPAADHVARWDGTAWHAVGADAAATDGWFPASSFIYGLTTYGSIVVAAGSFQNAGGKATADDIAYFDGTSWHPVGSDGSGNGPFGSQPTSLAVTDGKLYAGGGFTSAGGDSLGRFLAAYAVRQPDASVSLSSSGSYLGNNVYSGTGAGEVRHVTVTRGRSTTTYVKIQNDGLVPATFHLTGTGGARGITATWFRGPTNVTSDVKAGTYATGPLAVGATIQLRVVIKVAKSSAATATVTTKVRSQSGTPADAVRVAVKAR